MTLRPLLLSIGFHLITCGMMAQTPGDVDGSGFVGQADAEMLIDHLLDVNSFGATQEARADCNGQAGLDAGDLVWIVNHEGFHIPDMASVPEGSFAMGDPWAEGEDHERPVHTVSLSAYEMGRFEVTNAEYAAFLNSALASGEITTTPTGTVVYLTGNTNDPLITTGNASPHNPIYYTDGVFSVGTRDSQSVDDHPVIQVSWYGAAAYCNWLSRKCGYQEVYAVSGSWESSLGHSGYHLPTEAQWERAAAWDPAHMGSGDYPVSSELTAVGHWRYGFTSDSISTSQATYDYVNPLGFSEDPYTTPVGYYGDSVSAVGCHDMCGNAWEWCNDWHSSTYYTSSPGSDPEGPSLQSARVLRGGGYPNPEILCRSAFRISQSPDFRSTAIGFRVARNP